MMESYLAFQLFSLFLSVLVFRQQQPVVDEGKQPLGAQQGAEY